MQVTDEHRAVYRHWDRDELIADIVGKEKAISELRAALTAALASAGEPVAWVAKCCHCGRIVDTREQTEGGDAFGAELNDGRWTCSIECWDTIVGSANVTHPAPQDSEPLVKALKSAEKALRPFYDAVFNDNGDITVTGNYDYDEAIAGYFAYKKVESALSTLAPRADVAGWRLVPEEPTDKMTYIGPASRAAHRGHPAQRHHPIQRICEEGSRSQPGPPAAQAISGGHRP